MLLYYREPEKREKRLNNSSIPLRWGEKRYYSLNYFLRQKYGQKVFKIPLNAGFTCPNRDGTIGQGGCLYSSPYGSGDYAGSPQASIHEQFVDIKSVMHRKWGKGLYIAYFQAFTNTYAPVDQLAQLYSQAMQEEGVVGLAIATRPDCLPDEVIKLLQEISRQTNLWVELGLQTTHEATLQDMNIGYTYQQYKEALFRLNQANIEVVTHIILGLPGETREDMMVSARRLAALPMQGMKIHMLHLMKVTGLEKLYRQKPFPLLTRDEYIELVIDILEITPPQRVIHRLTGDSPRDALIAPEWTLYKWEVLNEIDRRLEERQTWQGRMYSKSPIE